MSILKLIRFLVIAATDEIESTATYGQVPEVDIRIDGELYQGLHYEVSSVSYQRGRPTIHLQEK